MRFQQSFFHFAVLIALVALVLGSPLHKRDEDGLVAARDIAFSKPPEFALVRREPKKGSGSGGSDGGDDGSSGGLFGHHSSKGGNDPPATTKQDPPESSNPPPATTTKQDPPSTTDTPPTSISPPASSTRTDSPSSSPTSDTSSPSSSPSPSSSASPSSPSSSPSVSASSTGSASSSVSASSSSASISSVSASATDSVSSSASATGSSTPTGSVSSTGSATGSVSSSASVTSSGSITSSASTTCSGSGSACAPTSTSSSCSGSGTGSGACSATSSSTSDTACGPACGMTACPAKSTGKTTTPTNVPRRVYIEERTPTLFQRATNVVKRALPHPTDGETTTAWILDMFKNGGVQGDLLGSTDPNPNPVAKYWPFASTPLNAGVDGLYGCTSVVIASRAGVWASHFYETVGFQGTTQSNRVAWGQFQKYVLNTIAGTETVAGFTPVPNINGNPWDLNNDVQVLIATPSQQGSKTVLNKYKYPQQVSAIQQQLVASIPGLSATDITTWAYEVIPGSTADRTAKLASSGLGKVLITYDPNADDQGDKGYQVWAETNSAMKDTWGPNAPTGERPTLSPPAEAEGAPDASDAGNGSTDPTQSPPAAPSARRFRA